MVKKVVSKKVTGKVKITRKVISKKDSEQDIQTPTRSKKVCFYCQSKTAPSYTDLVTLRRYLTDRVKIVPKLKSNLCAKHQRRVTKQIKYARHLALLPFTPKV